MAKASRSSRLFRERAGLAKTVRGPLPRHDSELNPLHRYPLKAPLPAPEFLEETQGNPPPDRDITTEWPPG